MYKITRVEEVSRNTLGDLSFHINKYINAELQEYEFVIDIKYFNRTESVSNLKFEEPNVAHLIIGKLI